MSNPIRVLERRHDVPEDELREAVLCGVLATMGGLGTAIALLGAHRIISPGQWMDPDVVECSREEAQVIAELVSESLIAKGSDFTGSILLK